MKLPAEIYLTDSVRRIDRNAIDRARIDAYSLMTRAARAALALALREYPAARRWQIVCGGGNNGGDGYVLAALAGQQGIEASVIALVPPESLQGEAAQAFRAFTAAGGEVRGWHGQLDTEAELLVDAILGSGLTRNVEAAFAEAVKAICRHGSPVLALDIPSGVSGDTGEVFGCAVRADSTITFVGLKSGLFLGDAPDFVGHLYFDDLGIPAECRQGVPVALRRIDEADLRRHLPPRRRTSHKGDFGHLLLVGGAPGMAGAIQLGGAAALRCGAGRVSLATHPAHCGALTAAHPELMCHGIAEAQQLEPLLERASTVAIGPGLGTGKWGRDLLRLVLASGLPSVLDADALNLLAAEPERRGDWILTPHAGEAARLLDSAPARIQAARPEALAALQERYGGTVVLKGAGTLVGAGEAPPWLCTSGNPGMAAPGMGDVLTGVIGGLLAQGLAPEQAAVVGVEVHARAGDAAAAAAPRGLIASDVIDALRPCVNP